VERHDVIVVGGGAGGLAAASSLRRAGLPALVLEAESEPGASWRRRYDRVRLHTPRGLSSLPGAPIPRRYGRWVAREDLVTYFTGFAASEQLEVRTGVRVERIDAAEHGWRLTTTAGPLAAQTVIVASGDCIHPRVPDWPGLEGFTGKLIHSSQYRNPAPFRGMDVLVVGAGNSGSEIACDVLEGGATRSRLSVRTPPQILPRTIAGVPVQRVMLGVSRMPDRYFDRVVRTIQRLTLPDLEAKGLPRPQMGIRDSVALTGTVPIVDVGIIDAVRAGRVGIVAAVAGFDGPEVLLADGSRVAPDAVIAATGFRAGLDEMVGHLDVLRPDGKPIHSNGEPAASGLWFIGFRSAKVSQLHQLGRAARSVASQIARRPV